MSEMQTIKATRPYFTLTNGAAKTFILRASKRAARRMVRTVEYRPGRFTTRMDPALERELLTRGLIEPYGCNCSHCAMDYDCCGRLFPAYVDAQRVRGGIRITQHYERNI